jgi:hypothetical protein
MKGVMHRLVQNFGINNLWIMAPAKADEVEDRPDIEVV